MVLLEFSDWRDNTIYLLRRPSDRGVNVDRDSRFPGFLYPVFLMLIENHINYSLTLNGVL